MKPYQYFPSCFGRVFPRGPRCCLSCNQHHLWLPKAAGAELLSQVYLVAGGHCGAQVGVTQCWSMDRKDGHPLVGQLRLEWILLEATWTSLTQVRRDAAPTGAQTAPQAAGSPQCLRISACYTGDPFPKPLWPQGGAGNACGECRAGIGSSCNVPGVPHSAGLRCQVTYRKGLYTAGIYPALFPDGRMSSTAFSPPQLPVGMRLLSTEQNSSHHQFLRAFVKFSSYDGESMLL